MGRIKPDTRLCDIENISRDFSKLSKWLLLTAMKPANQTIEEKYGPSAPEICAALNAWEDDAISGAPASVNLYSREEIEKEPDKGRTHLFYMAGEEGAPWVVICPGGAYAGVALMGEGFPAALEVNRMGYNAFILQYRAGRHCLGTAPVEDLATAIRRIRASAAKFKISRDEYYVLGFSAGGHLAAEWGTDNLGYMNYRQPKPKGIILGYGAPCVRLALESLQNTEEPAEKRRMTKIYLSMLLGKDPDMDKADFFSADSHVSAAYPPVYAINCGDDPLVSPAETMLLRDALNKNGVKCTVRLEETGGHGFGTGYGTPLEDWLDRAFETIG